MNTNLFKQNKECKILRDTSTHMLYLPMLAEVEKDLQNKIIKIIKDTI